MPYRPANARCIARPHATHFQEINTTKIDVSHIVATVTLMIVVVAFIALTLGVMTLHASPIPVSVKGKLWQDSNPCWANTLLEE